MKKKLIVLIALVLLVLGSVSLFAQNDAARVKALKGTWNLIALLNDDEYFDEAALKSNGVSMTFIFTDKQLTIKSAAQPDYTDAYTPVPGYLSLGNGEKMPYYLAGNILVLPSNNRTLIFRKK